MHLCLMCVFLCLFFFVFFFCILFCILFVFFCNFFVFFFFVFFFLVFIIVVVVVVLILVVTRTSFYYVRRQRDRYFINVPLYVHQIKKHLLQHVNVYKAFLLEL